MKTTLLAVCLITAATPAFADKKAEDTGAASEANVSVEVKAGTGVEKHEVVGEAASFTQGTTVFVWSRISDGPSSIKHVWKRDGKAVWTATLPVKSKKWSTQSRRAMTKPGAYEVEVTSADGASLGKIEFTVTASDATAQK